MILFQICSDMLCYFASLFSLGSARCEQSWITLIQFQGLKYSGTLGPGNWEAVCVRVGLLVFLGPPDSWDGALSLQGRWFTEVPAQDLDSSLFPCLVKFSEVLLSLSTTSSAFVIEVTSNASLISSDFCLLSGLGVKISHDLVNSWMHLENCCQTLGSACFPPLRWGWKGWFK